MQPFAGVGVDAIGLDDQLVVGSEVGKADARRLVVVGDVECGAIEDRGMDSGRDDVDEAACSGRSRERDGGLRRERLLAGCVVAVGEIEFDQIVLDGQDC